ncbi:hypothetical protein PsorP6_010946 [Peronosclerospora sorghi]|uniref:Uncharacterized protein n=1 Tax=Peronosclerospora sorghi TaxID=230839 RepID=A0ACC0VXC2_9STRA|nr:hypothetical protein PsorP6_010946 [Peronosclerospora sorghi]
MKIFPPMLAAAALTVSITEAEEGVRYGPWIGGPNSDYFSGAENVGPGTIVTEVRLNGAERVDGIAIVSKNPGAASTFTFRAGGDGGETTTLTLGKGEHITSVEYHSDELELDQSHRHTEKILSTRLFFLALTTNKNNTISVGQRQGKAGFDEAPFRYQLSSFYGYEGDEIDMAGAIFTSIDKKPQIVAVPP